MAKPGWLDRQMERAEREMAVLKQWEEGDEGRHSAYQRSEAHRRLASVTTLRTTGGASQERDHAEDLGARHPD